MRTLDDVASPAIRDAAERALAAGLTLESVAQWSKALVVHFREPLPDDLKAQIEAAHPALQWYSNDGSPHNEPDCGWVDGEYAISFPRNR